SHCSGYVGCSYIQNQIYSSGTNYVLDNFNADGKSLDLDASFSIPAPNEAVHITVNNEVINLYDQSPMKRHIEADNFYVTISWIRISPLTNFAVQFDLGVDKND
ncbi:hypothetical protein PENTCL1PPCAC_15093, partial [Pristionchus entomophagus]